MEDMQTTFREKGVNIVTTLALSPDYNMDDIRYVLSMVKKTDSRFVSWHVENAFSKNRHQI
jgi:hypothetical protein